MTEFAIAIIFGFSALTFAYFSMNLNDKHVILKIGLMLMSFFLMAAGFSVAVEFGNAISTNVASAVNTAYWILIYTILMMFIYWFFYLLYVALKSFKWKKKNKFV